MMNLPLQKLGLTLLAVIALTYTSQAQCTGTVYIPDANMKNALIGIGVDDNGDGEIQCAEARTYTETLYLSNNQIADATGLEAFINLRVLYINNNTLTSLDVSSNTALTKLDCSRNSLKSIDVSSNTALIHLNCFSNQLTSIEVSSNTALTELFCSSNQLTSIDASANTALTELFCSNNSLTSIDVSSNTALTDIICNNNQLPSLDVSNNTALKYLFCENNSLTHLDVSANTELETIVCRFNSLTSLNLANGNNANMGEVYITSNDYLTCVQVDDEGASYMDGWIKDPIAEYSNNCSVSITESVNNQSVELYPNPTNGRFVVGVTMDALSANLDIYNPLGKLVYSTTLLQSNTTINLENLSKGIYLVKTTNVQGNSAMQKLMVE